MQSETAAGNGMEKANPHNNVNLVRASPVGNPYKVQRTNTATSHVSNEKSSTNASESHHLLNDSVFNPREGELVAAHGSKTMHTNLNNHTENEQVIGAAATAVTVGRGGEGGGEVEALSAEASQHHKRELMTPVLVLILMCILNFFIYFDRGAINGALLSIQDDRKISPNGKLSDSRGGMIGSVFMFGYMFTCPMFSSLNGLIPTKYIILLGMIIWCASCVGSGLAVSYGTLLAARTFVGVGEAAMVGVSLTVIDNIAPLRSRTLWIGIFFAMMPLATAVGMYSGNIAGGKENLFHTWLASWRATFVLEAIVCVPVLVCLAFLPKRYDIREHALEVRRLKKENKKRRKENEKNKDKTANNNNNNNQKDREESEAQSTHAVSAAPVESATSEVITGAIPIQHGDVNNVNHREHDALEESITGTNDSGDLLGSKRGISEIIKESDVSSETNYQSNNTVNATAVNAADVQNQTNHNNNNENDDDEDDDDDDDDEDGVKYISFITASIEVLLNIDYDLIVLGFATYCFVVGAVSMWAIPFLTQSPLQMQSSTAALVMGAAIITSGTIGSILGGVVIDRLTKEKKTDNNDQVTPPPDANEAPLENVEQRENTQSENENNTHVLLTREEERALEQKTELAHWDGTVKAQLFDILMIIIGLPLGIVALMITKIYIFVITFFISVMAIYALTAPINAAILTVVRPALRPYSVSYSVLFIHLLGDFPSPTLTGYFSDRFGKHCHSMSKTQCKQSASEHCRWVESTSSYKGVSDSEEGTCESEHQVRNALALVFLVLIIAIPCWGIVYYRLRRVLKRKQLAYANHGEDNSPDSVNE